MPDLRSSQELLTTGQAANVIGCSRQHVVDLCNAGQLPHQTTPVHRRIRREDAETMAFRRRAAALQRSCAAKSCGRSGSTARSLESWRRIHGA